MTSEVETKTETESALPDRVRSGAWGAVENIDQRDLIVPKIYHLQSLSQFVTDDVARPGDFVDSLTGEILALKTEPLGVVVFGSYKSMIVSKRDGDKFNTVEIVTITPENAAEYVDRPYISEDGEIRNQLIYNFYCLLPSKVNELPYVLSLGGSKIKAAKKLNTMLFRLSQMKRAGASVVFELTSTAEKNDKGSWFGIGITQGRDATDAEMGKAYEWYKRSKKVNLVSVEPDGAKESDGDDIPF